MSLLSPQVWIRIAIVVALMVGLVRPPFGEDHEHRDSAHIETIHDGRYDHVSLETDQDSKQIASLDAHVEDLGDRHDASDHSHVASSLPPSSAVLGAPSFWTAPMAYASVSCRTAASSFERPPRPAFTV